MTSGPLDGIKVLEISIALTGPYAAALLADQGAEVIKVERPGIGDIGRYVGVTINGMSALYVACNRGKRSIAVDLQTPAGVDIVSRLAADRRRGDPELSARRARPARARLRRRAGDQPGGRLRVVVRLRLDRALSRSVGLRHGDPGLRRAGDQPGRPARRCADVPAADRGRQGHRPVSPRKRSAQRCSPAPGAAAANTSSCRWPMRSSRSCGPMRRPTRS